MKCRECEAIFGNHYELCPACGSWHIYREQKVIQPNEIVEYEPVSAYVMGSEITIGELESQ